MAPPGKYGRTIVRDSYKCRSVSRGGDAACCQITFVNIANVGWKRREASERLIVYLVQVCRIVDRCGSISRRRGSTDRARWSYTSPTYHRTRSPLTYIAAYTPGHT